MTESEILQLIRKEVATAIPTGTIVAFPSTTIPEGYLPCEGQEISIKQYEKLYAVIGKTFGGTSRTFKLPDLQGQFIRGLDREGNVDMNEDTGELRTLGSLQEDAIQGHRHSIPSLSTSNDGSHTHKVYYKTYNVGSNVFDNDMPVYEIPSSYSSSHSYGGDPGTSYNGSHSHSTTPNTTGGAENHSFGTVRVSSETRPTNVALIFCIKVY